MSGKQADVVVIGGSAAGIPAAITCRRHYPDKRVLVIRKEKEVQIPCGIPYIYGTVGGPDNNMIPDGALTNNGIDFMVDEVTGIDREGKEVSTAGGEVVVYDRLILATGSEPLKLPIPGLDKGNVFAIKKETGYLARLLDAVNSARDIVILGGGFIGVEFADECRKGRNVNVTIVEMLSHCLMLAFEEDLCLEAEEVLRSRGVNLATGVKLEEVLGGDNVEAVRLSDGTELKADLVIVGIGVKPNIALAEAAGLEVDKWGVVVDSTMRTSDESIFACGDCTSKRSFFSHNPTGMKLASIATMEARIAGANLFGTRRHNQGALGVFSTAIGGTTFAMAGLTESAAKEIGFEVVSGQAESVDRHPGKMPGASKMKVKLNFNGKTGEIIGGQVRGGPNAGEVVNIVSACIQMKMTADDIATFQMGTHPAVTASPIAYPLVNAAEIAIKNMG